MYVLEEPRFLRHDYHSTDDNDDDAEKVLTEDERKKSSKIIWMCQLAEDKKETVEDRPIHN